MMPRLLNFLILAIAIATPLQGQTPPVVTSGGVVNAASFLAPVAPGSIISIFGQGFAQGTAQATSLPLPTTLGTTSVTVNGAPVPLFYVGATQINAQLPSATTPGQAIIVVSFGGLASNPTSFTVTPTAPGIFTSTQSQAIVFNQDGSLNGAAKPAAPGSIVTLFLTGAGAVSNLPADGTAPLASSPSVTPDTPTITFGGVSGTVAYSGLSSCCVALWQINATVPVGAPAGNAIPVQVTLDGAVSNLPTMAINPPSPLSFSPTTLSAAATVGANYQATFTTLGGTPPNTWTLGATGGLTGLSISTSGVLSGKPSAAGLFTLPITLKDSLGVTATHNVSLTVNPAPTFTTGLNLPSAMSGVAYSAQIAVSGGTLPLTVVPGQIASVSGLALSVSGSTVTLSGIPQSTVSGSFGIPVTIGDANGATVTAIFQLPLIAPLAITTASSLPPTSVGGTVSVQFAATGGSGALTWSGSGIPSALTFTNSGLLSGVISRSFAPATASLTVKVVDQSGLSATQTFQLLVNPPPSITTTTLPNGIVNTPYTATLQASSGTSPYTFSLASGSTLPAGLSLNASSGVISGAPAAAGSFSIQVQVTDSAGATPAQPQTLTLNVNPSTLSITSTATLPVAFVGIPYQTTLTAMGGAQPYTWATTGNLPAGLSFNSRTGSLSGTLTSAGSSNSFTFTVTLTDAVGTPATQQVQLIAVYVPLIITTQPLLGASQGYSYSRTLSAAGGQPPYTWQSSDLTLIGGLTLSSSGQITGIAQTGGFFMFTGNVTDSAGTTVSQVFSLTIGTPLTVITASLPAAAAGVLYSQQLDASGGVPPYIWSIPGSVGGDLSLSTTGILNGIPEEAYGPVSVVVQVMDQIGQSASTSFGQLSVNVVNPPAITTSSVPNGHVGSSYTYPLAATGGTSPYTWTVALGKLPPGMSLNNAQGIISGTPSQAGTYTFVVVLTDSNGFMFGMQYQITIN
jgi:uncharacterized protein (TIGR03437 family)